MRVYEAKMVYSLVSLGDEVQLKTPTKIADYLRSAFEENPMQEAFYCVHLDGKNHPLGLITLGTVGLDGSWPTRNFPGSHLGKCVRFRGFAQSA